MKGEKRVRRARIKMDEKCIGKEVKHKTYGIGTIKEFDGKHLKVCFGDVEKSFLYPDAFRKFMAFTDDVLENEVLADMIFTMKTEEPKPEPVLPVREASKPAAGKKASSPFGKRPEIAAATAEGYAASDEYGFQDWTDGRFHITADQWKMLITDIKVFTADDFIFFGRLYACPEHTTTAELMASEEGKKQNAYNKQLFRLSNRVLGKLKLPLMTEKSGWALTMLAKPYKETLMWKLRPELTEAFEEVYPEQFHI